jgi:hypothetical protein
MPLIQIENQPLFPNPRPTNCFSCDERDYCHPFIGSDLIRAQFKQTPCADSIVCDGRFISIDAGDQEEIADNDFSELGLEKLINGVFTGSASGWTLQSGWTYGTNAISKTATGGNASASQLLSNTVLANTISRVVFTVTNYTAGTFTPVLTDGISSYNGTPVSANGTYTQYIKVLTDCTNLFLTGNAAFIGTVDTVSLKQIAQSWKFGNNWFINSAGQATNTAPGSLLQILNILNPGADYDVSIDLDAASVGGFEYFVGSTFSPFTSSTGGGTITGTLNAGSGTNFGIQLAPGTVIIINSISVKSTIGSGECWTFDADKWIHTGESLCKISVTSDNLINAAPIIANTYYQLKFTIAGDFTGSILPYVANAVGILVTKPGDYIQYFSPTVDGFLKFFADASFAGCISNIQLFVLRKDYIFSIENIADDTIGGTLTARYDEDYVTIAQRMDSIEDSGDPLPYGCYKIKIFDQCDLQYEEIIGDTMLDSIYGKYWVDKITGANPGATIEVTGNELVFTYPPDAFGQVMIVFNCRVGSPNCQREDPLIPRGPHNYRIEFDITENTNDTDFYVFVQLAQANKFTQSKVVGHYSFDLIGFDPSAFYDFTGGLQSQNIFGINVTFSGSLAGQVKLDNITMHRIEPFDVTYESVCIKYDSSFKCTSLIEADCDAPQMGFKFFNDLNQQIFKLSQRIYLRAINPSYPEDGEAYTYSDGTKTKNYGKSEKSITLLTDAIDEASLDALAKMRICQRFVIDGVEWISLPGDLTPEWLKNGDSILSPVRFDVQQKVEGAKFFRNS